MTKRHHDSYVIDNVRLLTTDGITAMTSIAVIDSVIAAIGPMDPLPFDGIRVIDAGGLMAVPAFIDMHIHGAGGMDPCETGISIQECSDRLEKMASCLADTGIGTFVVATVFNMAVIERFARVLDMHPRLAATVAGLYLEGPFIAPSKRGGIPLECIQPYSDDVFQAIASVTSGTRPVVRLMTVAPELEGIETLPAKAEACGINICWGHSDAALADVKLQDGDHFTHLFNAMRGLDHRNPGLALAPFLPHLCNATFELIGDGIHIAPDMLSFICAQKTSKHHACLISDAISCAGLGPMEFSYCSQPAVSDGRVARYRDSGTLIGSAMTLAANVHYLVSHDLIDPSQACCMASTNPARVLGLHECGSLEVGRKADILLCSDDMSVKAVYLANGYRRDITGTTPKAMDKAGIGGL